MKILLQITKILLYFFAITLALSAIAMLTSDEDGTGVGFIIMLIFAIALGGAAYFIKPDKTKNISMPNIDSGMKKNTTFKAPDISKMNFPVGAKYKETYLYGFPNYNRKKTVRVKITDVYLEFYFQNFGSYDKIQIPYADVIEISLDNKTTRSGGGAAVGYLAGGIVGAAIGGRSKAKGDMQLMVKYNNQRCVISFKPSKTLPKLYADIQRNLPLE